MANKTNHRRKRGHVRRRNPHPCGRAVCGVCGPKAMLKKRAIREKIEREELRDGR